LVSSVPAQQQRNLTHSKKPHIPSESSLPLGYLYYSTPALKIHLFYANIFPASLALRQQAESRFHSFVIYYTKLYKNLMKNLLTDFGKAVKSPLRLFHNPAWKRWDFPFSGAAAAAKSRFWLFCLLPKPPHTAIIKVSAPLSGICEKHHYPCDTSKGTNHHEIRNRGTAERRQEHPV